MNSFKLRWGCFLVVAAMCPVWPAGAAEPEQTPQNELIDYRGFLELSAELQPIREARRIPVEKFLEMAKENDTVLLDTRSKSAFDEAHLAGAVHLNFSDFTAEKLAKVIPEKTTRILIYCNNNFAGERQIKAIAALRNKKPALALNIPTFINLYGYGYENLFELADVLSPDQPGIPLEGTAVGQ